MLTLIVLMGICTFCVSSIIYRIKRIILLDYAIELIDKIVKANIRDKEFFWRWRLYDQRFNEIFSKKWYKWFSKDYMAWFNEEEFKL